ncbi:redoxin domain-containing protein [Glaciihabitans sp. INWT7]|uniref:redoxin domain-containing protein n=1 Tax=Glaciihabitans sp. INWT7 TaxID=2596912 RepID=UPI001628544D|nr:redoxin domain-containing protein [Glaciihabitans sp. INWT7]QNE45890.1 redoxin domain-containing protein [Glaciihabitans sp. INWT7]
MKNDQARATNPTGGPRGLLWATIGGVVALALVVVAIVALVPAAPSTPGSAAEDPVGIGRPASSLLELANLGVSHTRMPDFALTDQRGKPLSLSQFAGRAVVLSFNDDQCEDLCTLLAQDVAAADHDLGARAKDVAFVSVNANPYYPAVDAVKTWTDAHGLASASNWYFGTGPAATLASVAKKYGVPITLHAKSRTVDHGAQLFFIDPKGDEAQVGGFGTGAASTTLFGHAMAQLAVSLLPAAEGGPVGGPAMTASAKASAQLGDSPAPAQLPSLGTSSSLIGTTPAAGKYEVINFWSSTCTACVQELPEMQSEFVKDGRTVEFIGVDVSDAAGSAVAFAAHAGITYPLAADRSGTLAGEFQITGLPYTVILDPAGTVLVRHPGAFTAEQLDYVLDTFDPALGGS